MNTLLYIIDTAHEYTPLYHIQNIWIHSLYYGSVSICLSDVLLYMIVSPSDKHMNTLLYIIDTHMDTLLYIIDTYLHDYIGK